ncbi:DUF3068 domain-containing protein [Corynebacterium senegalense]|uniref:DUF3068 domain-containing protein n=1 Tax=Corynebacterium senegalense TaxID=2080750 RepID=UPI000E1FE472|nr:DUF3068 domain-containing protein [Corynebacterium senegalense]
MLPRSRILPILLAGVGIALIVGGLVAPRFLLGDGRLPLDLENSTWTLRDPEGTYLGEPAPVTRQLHMGIQNPADRETTGVRVGDTLRAGTAGRDFDNLVSAATWSYEMDRVTGQPTGDMRLQSVMAMPETTVSAGGQWLKFPADVAQEDYEVFDPTLRATAPAHFVGQEEVAGRTVYRFEQDIAPTNVALAYADLRNTTTVEGPEGEQIRAFLFHSARRVILVDQVSGLVVGLEEKVDDYYADAQGARLKELVTYDARMDEAQVEGLAGQLGTVFSQAQSRAVTIGVIALGALLAVAGLAGAVRPERTRPRHTFAE